MLRLSNQYTLQKQDEDFKEDFGSLDYSPQKTPNLIHTNDDSSIPWNSI